jgi:hypothetical protein
LDELEKRGSDAGERAPVREIRHRRRYGTRWARKRHGGTIASTGSMDARTIGPVTVREIVGELQQAPVFSVADAKRPTGIPTESGCYAWWCTPGAVPDVPTTLHPSEALGLLYVGIAPRDAESCARLRSRLCQQHIGGNIGASTFRFGLAALLWEQNGWTPRMSTSGRFTLDRRDNRALSQWQTSNLRLRWAVSPEPWDFEIDLIAAMQPPMNREHNEKHPFYECMGDARDRFRDAARATLT